MNHGPIELGFSHRADAESATMIVPADNFALNGLSCYEAYEHLGGLLAATVNLAVSFTGLSSFGSVDTVEPKWDGAYFDRVTVHDIASRGCLTQQQSLGG
jgi:hypothetical protein